MENRVWREKPGEALQYMMKMEPLRPDFFMETEIFSGKLVPIFERITKIYHVEPTPTRDLHPPRLLPPSPQPTNHHFFSHRATLHHQIRH